MGDRDRHRDRDHRDHRDRDRDRERDRRRDKEDRDRDRDRNRTTRSPDRSRSRHARSPDRHRSRSRSPDTRSHRRHRNQRTPSPSPPRKRHRHDSDTNDERQKAAVSDFLDKIAREQMEITNKKKSSNADDKDKDNAGDEVAEDEMEMMKMLGIPTGFDSTKGKAVPGADVSGVRAVTKRQPRQYMNRRGGFNRPLPAERSR